MADIQMPVKFLYEVSVQLLSYNEICDALGLTAEERKHPSAGKWIIDRYKQLQTAALLTETMKSKRGGNLIDEYSQEDKLVIDPLKDQPIETPING